MPSTVVHVAVAGLVAVALLGDEFTPRALGLGLFAAAVIDTDAFVGLYLPGAHRSLFHTFFLPLGLVALVVYDTRVRSHSGSAAASTASPSSASMLRRRWGDHGVRVAWVAVACLALGGILPDLTKNGVNAFYPLHDAFYTLDGKLFLSNQRGLVQTFFTLHPEKAQPTTRTLHYSTGVDPRPGAESADVERIFPVVMAGWQLTVVVVSTLVMSVRLWEYRRERP